MPGEMITTITAAVGLLLTLAAGFGWMVHRMDALGDKLSTRIDAVDDKLSARIDGVEKRLSARIDAVERRLTARIDAVEHEVTDVKIAVARIEGPPGPRLILTR